VRYSSRIASHIARQLQAHRLRHVISQLAARLPEAERNSEVVRELAGYGCQTRMHVVRLLAPQLDMENHTKDIDCSPSGIMQRWDAGYEHAKAVLDRSPWVGEFDPLSGVVLHEQMENMPVAAGVMQHDPEKHALGPDPMGGNRFSLGANAKRLPGDGAQTKRVDHDPNRIMI
jgi:NTE family protein